MFQKQMHFRPSVLKQHECTHMTTAVQVALRLSASSRRENLGPTRQLNPVQQHALLVPLLPLRRHLLSWKGAPSSGSQIQVRSLYYSESQHPACCFPQE